VAISDRRKFAAPVLAQAASFVVVLVIGGFTGHSPATRSPGPTHTSASPSVGVSSPPGVKEHQAALIVEVPLGAATGGIAMDIAVRVLDARTGGNVLSGSMAPNVQDTEASLDESLPSGSYQVCAQAPEGLRFTDKNSGMLPGWVCQPAILVPSVQATVVFHLASGAT
jgi:hypothetical protein